ncbi:MAG TPA: class I SAM-dependent methyltransferase, partial [Ideonella sp.]|nr:class I SAM-dependent methyltransferase [Ideonella sp.]
RHALVLAAAGAHVTAVDRDAEALAVLRDRAAAAGLAHLIETRRADLEPADGPWPLAGAQFDAVVVTTDLWRPRHEDLLRAVAPGGCLLHETFAAGQETVGRPSRPEFLLQPGELLARLAGPWRVLAYEDLRLPAPDRFVQRVLARRLAA